MEVFMKKIILAIALMVFFTAVTPVFAQQISEKNQSEYYYVNIPVEKIHLYRSGYIVQYRQGINKIGTLYIPHQWFTSPGGKAEEILLPGGKEWPTLTVYYKEGEFSHLRLYVHRWRGHATWGVVPMTLNLDDRFEGVETLDIVF